MANPRCREFPDLLSSPFRAIQSCFSFAPGVQRGIGSVRAEESLAPLFSDHAVLQRDKPVPIWGRADAGEKIAVTFLGQQVHATTGADGRWLVFLAPLATNAEGTDLSVVGKNNTLIVHDVVVGEVWLCSGQSNMEWPVAKAADAPAEIVAEIIRQLDVAPRAPV